MYSTSLMTASCIEYVDYTFSEIISDGISDGIMSRLWGVMLCCHCAASPVSRVTVENAFLEEKEDACNALGEIAAQTG